MVRCPRPALVPPLKPVNGSVAHTAFLFQSQDSEIAFCFFFPFFSEEIKMQANKAESCLLSAQNNPGSHEKTIPIRSKPRRHEGFGIHCWILCIIKKIPHPPRRTPSLPYQSSVQAQTEDACSSSSTLIRPRPEPGSPSNSDDTRAGIQKNVTLLGFFHFHIFDWLAENYDLSVRRSTSGSCLLLPTANRQN